jgi:hypothetical protein
MKPFGFMVMFILAVTSRLDTTLGISVRELHLRGGVGKFSPKMDGERCGLICCECEKVQPIEPEITEGFLKKRKQTFKAPAEDDHETALGELMPKKFKAPREIEDNHTSGEILPRKLKVQFDRENELEAVGEILPRERQPEISSTRKELPPPGEIKKRHQHFDEPHPELEPMVGELAPKKIKAELNEEEDEPHLGMLKPRERTRTAVTDDDDRPVAGELKGKRSHLPMARSAPRRLMVMGKLRSRVNPCHGANVCKE